MTRRSLQVAAAGLLTVGMCFVLTTSAESQTPAPVSAVSTPRAPDGKPDLSGMWNGSGGALSGYRFTNQTEEDGDIIRLFPSRRCAPNQIGCRDNTNQANDGEFTGRTDPNRPLYDDFCQRGLDMTNDEKLAALEKELDRVAI